MTIEFVDTNGHRTDLRFVSGFSIKLADMPPEIVAEFEEVGRFRERWHAYLSTALGLPADLLQDKGDNRNDHWL